MAASQTVHINSKERVADHGEVMTGEREVNAMLDMVLNETLNIDSRFLEPACGDGNFLDEVLRRKLSVVDSRYKKSPPEWERYAFVALSSLYGIDILQDNVQACRERLLLRVIAHHENTLKRKPKPPFIESLRFVLSKNIIWGDALSLKRCDGSDEPIVFSEWSPLNGTLIKRKDFEFSELLPEDDDESSLFKPARTTVKSDLGQAVFIPSPVREFPPVHYLRVSHE